MPVSYTHLDVYKRQLSGIFPDVRINTIQFFMTFSIFFRVLHDIFRALLYSSLAQPVKHAAVNRRVVGSSPTGGAKRMIARKAAVDLR